MVGTVERYSESAECQRELLSWLKGCGLPGVRLLIGDKANAIAEILPDAVYQRRSVLAKVAEYKRR